LTFGQCAPNLAPITPITARHCKVRTSQENAAMSITHNDIGAVKALPLFDNLPPEALSDTIGHAVVRQHPIRTMLFVQGDDADRFFVLLGGWVKLFRQAKTGAEAIIEVIGPGESFAEAAALGLGHYPVSAECATAVRLLEVPAEPFKKQLAEDPELMLRIIASLSVRLKGFVRRNELLITRTASQRVAMFLLAFASECSEKGTGSVKLPYNKLLIAGRLGMKPETFSRALSELRQIGVNVTRSEVLIDDVRTVEEFANGGDA
jgi:CRP-like cAMP-binding protein